MRRIKRSWRRLARYVGIYLVSTGGIHSSVLLQADSLQVSRVLEYVHMLPVAISSGLGAALISFFVHELLGDV